MVPSERRSDRLPVSILADAYVGERAVQVRVSSISDWGIGFDAPSAAFVGRNRFVQLQLPLEGEHESIWLAGIVARRSSDSELYGEFALRFETMPECDRQALRRWLAVRRLNLVTAAMFRPAVTRTIARPSAELVVAVSYS